MYNLIESKSSNKKKSVVQYSSQKLKEEIILNPLSRLNCISIMQLGATVQQDNYSIVAITETWWVDSHNWSAAMDSCKLFRRDRHGGEVVG